MTNAVDLAKDSYLTGFFITENDEIVYSAGESYGDLYHVIIVRMLNDQGPIESYERIDRLRPASLEDAKKFNIATYDYYVNKIDYYQMQINKLQEMITKWAGRFNAYRVDGNV